jgi:hypothetical protein
MYQGRRKSPFGYTEQGQQSLTKAVLLVQLLFLAFSILIAHGSAFDPATGNASAVICRFADSSFLLLFVLTPNVNYAMHPPARHNISD